MLKRPGCHTHCNLRRPSQHGPGRPRPGGRPGRAGCPAKPPGSGSESRFRRPAALESPARPPAGHRLGEPACRTARPSGSGPLDAPDPAGPGPGIVPVRLLSPRRRCLAWGLEGPDPTRRPLVVTLVVEGREPGPESGNGGPIAPQALLRKATRADHATASRAYAYRPRFGIRHLLFDRGTGARGS